MMRYEAAVASIVLAFTIQHSEAASTPLSLAADGHVAMPVMLNGEGPFEFTLDTAAQRPMIAPALAEKLKVAATNSAHVHGSSGTGTADFTEIENFRSALFDRKNEPAVIAPTGSVVSVGVVGMDAFLDKRLELDFSGMSASAAASGPTPAGFTAIPVNIHDTTMIIANVTVNGVPAKAVVDSGARRTIANAALQAALGFKDGDPRFTAADAVGGATGDKSPANKAELETIKLGKATFEKPLVTFADLPVFEPLGLAHTPGLILGLDQLKHLKAMAIDYPRSELQIKP